MKLIEHVLKIRGLIQQAVENSFARFGAPENIIATHQVAMDGDYDKARLETVKECVFTLFNRLAALKVMEDRELFPEVIRRRAEHGNLSYSHKMWLEEHPDMRSAERMGLKDFLSDKFQQLFEEYGIPLYKANHPYAVMPTADELDEIITAFNDIEQDEQCGSDIWKGDDILGWMYENFNKVEKEQLKKSGEKTEYDKVSLQSQVYTPQWVVKFLVDNTLGKQYLEMYPDSRFMIDEETGKTKYLIANAPKQQVRHPKKNGVLGIKLIDPACGSGNFLIYAFSVFYDMYVDQMENYGADFSRRDIPKLIVENNLYGVDLDERAVQLTQIALFIKAMQLKGRRGKMPTYCNVVSSHFTLPAYEQIAATFDMGDSHWDYKQREVLKDIWNDLCNAHKFGSLIRLKEKIEALMPSQEVTLFSEIQIAEFFSFRNQALSILRQQVHQWGGEGSNAYSLSLVNDAMTFLDILTTSFDVAVANPPYTDSSDFGPELKAFAEANYKRPMKFNINLYACFIKRCCELTDELGKVGMIHPHTFMFIKTFEDVRKFMIEHTHINTMVDFGLDRVNLFGPGVLLDATFYTLDKKDVENTPGVYFNITANLQEKYKKGTLEKAYADYCNGQPNDRVYLLPQDKLKAIKSWPFIYWISDEFREKFGSDAIQDVLKPAQGAATTNNNRFLRFWWEVANNDISINYSEDHKKWVGYSKGGSFKKWWGNAWLLINWNNDGYELKHSKAVLRNADCYFKEGITYCASGSKGTSFRYHNDNSLFDTGGSCIFMKKYNDLYYSLAFLNSELNVYITTCLNPTVNTQVGDMQRVPFVIPEKNEEKQVSKMAFQNRKIQEKIGIYSIVEQNYSHSPITPASSPESELTRYYNYENALLTLILLNEAIINRIVFDVYELSEHDRQMVLDKECVPVGDLSVSQAALDEYKQWLQENQEFPASTEVWEHLDSLAIDNEQPQISDFDKLYQNNYGWEEFCNSDNHRMNPIEVWYQFRHAGVLPPQRTQSLSFELITDVIRAILKKDDDGVIPLCERMGEEPLDVRIEQELVERGYSGAQISQIEQLLCMNLGTGKSLRKYLYEKFFQQLSDHLNLFMYLPKTPFIWHLTSGDPASGHSAIDLYISIYTWSRDTLFRIKSVYVANRENALADRLVALDPTSANGKMEAALIKDQQQELRQFADKIDQLLASGYDPKLDDGVGKNIAPLQKAGLLSYDVLNSGQLKKYLNADW
ncbi:MAG: BREX-1 system adenine-specific DNA-methyltransferase PglX [Prevotella sp.]|nr:BREX-1 system adenine-specific DNA-methyltransferase PglX [Prevotella sp.]